MTILAHNDPKNLPPLTLLIGSLDRLPNRRPYLAIMDTCMTSRTAEERADVNRYSEPEVMTWIDENMNDPVTVDLHAECSSARGEGQYVYIWQVFRFENERDLMLFKVFWS